MGLEMKELIISYFNILGDIQLSLLKLVFCLFLLYFYIAVPYNSYFDIVIWGHNSTCIVLKTYYRKKLVL